MAKVTAHEVGMLCWAELSTRDASAAKRFYGELFGWTPDDKPTGPDAFYTILKVGSEDAAALYQQGADEQGAPSHWRCYFSTANADDTAKKVAAAGGTVIAPPSDVFDLGRMFIARDPTGALFCIWEPRKLSGVTWMNDPGGLCWSELMTPDPPTAEAFYRAALGWKAQTQEMEGTRYTVFMSGTKAAAGMLRTPPNAPIPPNWMPYFAVADCDATANKAKSLGGKLHCEPTSFVGVGRFATIEDPQGAVFGILQVA